MAAPTNQELIDFVIREARLIDMHRLDEWLDLFAEATRTVTGSGEPTDLLDARLELDGPGEGDGDRTIERIDPTWITAVARVPDASLDAIAGRWITLVEEELGVLPREEKPWIRDLAGQIVSFCRRADRSADVLFVWSLR